MKAGKALASAGGALGGSGAVAAATGAAGVGLVTAGVARLSWKIQTFGIDEIFIHVVHCICNPTKNNFEQKV